MTTHPKGSLISFMANKVKSYGGINLAQGIPAFDPPLELINELKKASELPVHQYAPGAGNKELLQLLIQQYKPYESNERNLLITNGATESISLIFTYLIKVLGRNFSALAFDPVYESYKHLPRIFNIPFHSFQFNNELSINFKQLEKQIALQNVKIVFVASPGNPWGKVWSKEECTQLIDLAEKHHFYIIWDAVYSELYFDKKPYEPLHKKNPNLFYVNAFSKQLSITGWRIGYTLMHEKHYEAMLDIHDYIGLSAPSVLQTALSSYLNRNNLGRDYTAKLREKLIQNYTQLSEALDELGFEIIHAQGGYFVWSKLPVRFNDGFQFAMELYEAKKVACVPGIHFSENGKNYVRFNIAQKAETLREAISHIKDFINGS